MRVGRVIAPIVRAIYDRDMEIRNFTPEKYYVIGSAEETNGEKIELISKEKFAKELLKLRDEEKQLEIIDRAEKEDWSFTRLSKEVKEEIKEMAKKRLWESKSFKEKNIREKMPVYINTVKKTVELLRKNGASVDFFQQENEEYSEFTVKIHKK